MLSKREDKNVAEDDENLNSLKLINKLFSHLDDDESSSATESEMSSHNINQKKYT